MIHIVFQQADIETLQKAIELDATLQGEILHIKDDFAVGPIADIYETEGYQNRRDWWKKVLENSPYTEQLDIVDDKLTTHQLQEKLKDEAEQAWIWMAPNQHDVCGYYWLINQLKEFESRIHILSLNNLPFINDKGSIFYPVNLSEIPPKEFIKAKKLARPVTISEFELDGDEWKKLCSENGMVRTLDGGKKIISREVSYYDDKIIAALTKDAQKLNKIFQTLFTKMKVHTGDAFLAWRMKELINDGKIELSGNWNNGWKEISLKLPGAAEEISKEVDINA
ncbi:DUF1835 domain-containing protein [Parafilimonas terrae]|uniref:DUF1835 domain-containing protein n=1 Tax=Parafilimonas terrae TaxID=1465490 RepID=A0A1I5YFU3_9BACT|nr:DUF1835 domain-containing protein [Parafilimonas terrae]SFQ43079.1 Protein of unknown function [Parafilimonas terrae]